MKSIISLFFIAISWCTLAQENITIVAATYADFTGEDASVFLVDVARVQKLEYMNHWEKYFKAQTDQPINRADNDITVKNATLKKLGNRVLTIFMHFQPSEAGTKVYIGFLDTVSGFYGPEHPQFGVDLKKLILEETQKVYVKTRGEHKEQEEAYLKTLEKELAALKKNEAKLEKNILKYEQELSKLNNDISINEGVVRQLRVDVSDARSSLLALPSDAPKETRKKAEREAKDIEKKHDNLRKKIDKDKQKVFDLKKKVSDEKYQVSKLQPDIDEANRKVEQQRNLLIEIQQDVDEMKR